MSSTLTIRTPFDYPSQIANMANSDAPAPRHSSRNVNSAYASNNMKTKGSDHKGGAVPGGDAWVNPPARSVRAPMPSRTPRMARTPPGAPTPPPPPTLAEPPPNSPGPATRAAAKAE